MTLDRRKFIGSMVAAGAAAHLAGCNGEDGSRVASQFNVRFDITGLFAFSFWQKSAKKIETLLIDGQTALESPAAVHAPLLIVRWDDFDDTRMGGESYYTPPQPVEVGGETLAVWSLVNRIVWIGGVHKDDKYDNDSQSNLTFVTGTYGSNPPPETPGSQAEWEDSYWFANLSDVLKKDPPIKIVKTDAITTKLLLTRGRATGRQPKTKCDRERKYSFKDVTPKPRAFSPHLVVTHPSTNNEMSLLVAATAYPDKPRPIYLKIKSGTPTGVSVMNGPVGHMPSTDHFNAFYYLVGVQDGPNLIVNQAEECKVSAKALAEYEGDPVGTINPSPPFEGCIPPGAPQE